jgi:hypothetical protein
MLWNDAMGRILATVVVEAREDLVGVWLVLRWVRAAFPQMDPVEAGVTTLAIIEKALASGEVEAGSFLEGSPKAFESWKLDPGTSLERIDRTWRGLGRDPDIGDNLWLVGRDTRYVGAT